MIFSAVFYQVSLEEHRTIYVLDPFHLKRVNKLYRKYKPIRITQKEHLLIIWNSETTQKTKHLPSLLPNRNSYFSSYKAWKDNYGIQLFKFLKIFPSFWPFGRQYCKNESIHLNPWYHSHNKQIDRLETQVVFFDILAWTWNICYSRRENTLKQQNLVAFVRNYLVKMTLRLF